jgi:hypothetical protein
MNRRTRVRALIARLCTGFCLLGGGSGAWAQEPAQPNSKQSQITDAKGRKVQVVDFDDANIEGKAKAPDGFVLQSRTPGSFKNIIELRRNFRQQIQGSAYESLVVNPSAP